MSEKYLTNKGTTNGSSRGESNFEHYIWDRTEQLQVNVNTTLWLKRDENLNPTLQSLDEWKNSTNKGTTNGSCRGESNFEHWLVNGLVGNVVNLDVFILLMS